MGAVLAVVAAAGLGTGARASTPPVPALVDLGGSPVEVSTNPAAPTVLTAGLWADTLSGPGGSDANAHRFRYERTMQDSTVLVGVVGASTETSDQIGVLLEAAGGPCDDQTSTSGAAGTAFGTLAVATSTTFGDRNDECLTAPSVDITVRRGTADLESDLPIAIRVVEEAPVRDAEADLPEVPDVAPFSLPQPADPTDLAGAPSFDEAPEITSGTYADALPEGSERLYRVRLDWGQSLAVRVDVAAQDAAATETFSASADPVVDLSLFDPLRNAFDGGAEDADQDGGYTVDGDLLLDGTYPVAYLNRYKSQNATVPGDYWVSVAVTPAAVDRAPVEVPVELTVEVVGEPVEPPRSALTVTTPDTDSGPDGYDPATPYLVDDGVFSADVSGTPRVPEAAGDDVRRTAGLVVGATSLVSLAAGAVLLLRRGRLSRAAAR